MSNKLELTWYGKGELLNVEPRLLIEDKRLSNINPDGISDNLLIHGDNLLALKALEKKYSKQIKCIYIDPRTILMLQMSIMMILLNIPNGLV